MSGSPSIDPYGSAGSHEDTHDTETHNPVFKDSHPVLGTDQEANAFPAS